jgi:Protein of unknown function (DUF1761)
LLKFLTNIFIITSSKQFFMDFSRVNWLAVIASAVAGMGIGFLWYGALFNTQWMAGNGITVSGEGAAMKMFKNGAEVPVTNLPMIINTVAMLIYPLLTHWILQKANVRTWASGAGIGLVIGLTHLLNVYVGNRFAMNPTSLSMVDGSYSLVLFTLIGAIMGGWQKK